MRTKEYDVQFNDGRLSIVRLRDGAPVVDSVEIPADAVGASIQVLAAAETARISASGTSAQQAAKAEDPEARSADKGKRATRAKTQESRAGARKARPAEDRSNDGSL